MHPFQHLLLIPAPRVQGRCAYPMDYLLLCLFLATLSGRDSWHGVADYTEYHLEGLRRVYGRRHGRECRLPRHLQPRDLRAAPPRLRGGLPCVPPGPAPRHGARHICLDGKTMRGVRKRQLDARAHCVSAYDPDRKAAVGQVCISSKSNEINALHELLGLVQLEGGGEYIFCIKGNQPSTRAEIGGLFAPAARAVHAMRRTRACKKTGQTGGETSYYISSIEGNGRVFALFREHWAVENPLHYLLDTVVYEDASAKRAGYAAQNMAIVSRINLALLQRLRERGFQPYVKRVRERLSMMPPEEVWNLEF